jgi:penicillin-binding protein 1A
VSGDDQKDGNGDSPKSGGGWSLEPYRFSDPVEPPRVRPQIRPRERQPEPRESGPHAGEARIFLPPEQAATSFGQRGDSMFPPKKPTKKKLNWFQKVAAMIGVLFVLGMIGAGGLAWYLFHDMPKLPATDTMFVQTRAPAMTFQDTQGHVIASRGKKTGYRVTLKELPAYVPHAFLAAEDRRFYSHGAVDLKGTARAMVANIMNRRVVQGGSTITQQITKTLFLKPDRKLKRKAQEAVLAWQLEKRLGKDQVLELYLNRVFFGEGAYGIDAASQIYFGKGANQLTLSEASLLAALPQQPSRFALRTNMPRAMERQKLILDIMGQQGWINQAELSLATASPPTLTAAQLGEGDIGYVLDYAAAEATRIAGAGAPDLLVTLTIDTRLQGVAQDVLRRTLSTDGKAAHATQGAFVAITPDGAIRALVGGMDHNASPFNRATQAKRQPGSSFKPFVYATALENGVKPNDVFQDAPLRIGTWNPTNYGGGYRGAVTVQVALAQSINTVAVRLGMKVGPRKIGELARRFGLSDIPESPDLAISLGAKEVTLLEMVNGYQVFQNQGERHPAYLIAAITSTRGDPIFSHTAPAPVPVYDKILAGEMVQLMRGVVERGTGTRAAFGRPAAGKTGTSQDWRDAWFVGFTPDWAGGVWIGNDDYTPMEHVAGGTLPAAIWRQFMVEAHKGIPAHGFDWAPPLEAPPPPPPKDTPDPRNTYYNELANDFSTTASREPGLAKAEGE